MSKKRELLKLFHGLLAVTGQPNTAQLIEIVGRYLKNEISLDETISILEQFEKKVETEEAA